MTNRKMAGVMVVIGITGAFLIYFYTLTLLEPHPVAKYFMMFAFPIALSAGLLWRVSRG